MAVDLLVSAAAQTRVVAAATPTSVPGWLAPGVLVALAGAAISFIGTIGNICFSVLSKNTAVSNRRRDFEGDQFHSVAGAALEAALGNVETFDVELQSIKAQIDAVPDSTEVRSRRVKLCEAAQLSKLMPALHELHTALRKAQHHAKDRSNWLELIDRTDAILTAMDALCRETAGLRDVSEAFREISTATHEGCIAIRSRLVQEQRAIRGL